MRTEEQKAARRAAYANSQERRAAQAYRSRNRSAIIEAQRTYREAHRKEAHDYYVANRKKIIARSAAWVAANPEKARACREAHYRLNRALYTERERNRRNGPKREEILEQQRERSRRSWQRSGSGVHLARIQDWREIFDGMANDTERCIAAHVLEMFAAIDDTARAIFADHSFDWNYIGQHFDIEKAGAVAR
jgi:hypothetical protein